MAPSAPTRALCPIRSGWTWEEWREHLHRVADDCDATYIGTVLAGLAYDLAMAGVEPEPPAVVDMSEAEYTATDIRDPENLAEARRTLASGTHPRITLAADDDSVFLTLVDGRGDAVDSFWVLDAAGPGQRAREQALDDAAEVMEELGIMTAAAYPGDEF